MPHYSVINTRTRQGLLVTLHAIGVCTWAQLADAASGIRITTGALWRQYMQSRADARAWRAAHPIDDMPTGWPEEPAEQLDESAIESLAAAFGRPVWLTGALMVLVIAGALIDVLGGWPLLFDACQRIGAGLAALVRS